MEIQSSTHRLALDDNTGEFSVWPLAERQLHVVEYQGGVKIRDGFVTQPDESQRRLLTAANACPLFAANFAGDGFNIDLDCGFQRWHGTKPEAQVRTALRRCGFSIKQSRMVLAAAKVQEHDWIRRYD